MMEIKLREDLILLLDDQDVWAVEKYSLVADRRGSTWYVVHKKKEPGQRGNRNTISTDY